MKRALRLALAAWLVLKSGPAPALAAIADSDSATLRVTPTDVYPPVPVTDLAGSAGAEGQALLQWTAPEESAGVLPKDAPPAGYVIRAATFSAADLGGDTTAWFDAAQALAAPPPLPPGSPQSSLQTLEGGSTWYFGIRSVDDAALVSDTDSQLKGVATQVAVPVKGIGKVSDLAASPGPASGDVSLTWTVPRRLGHADPVTYDMRVSSTAQINNNPEFDAAQPLTAFSASSLPPLGAAGERAQLTVTGLMPATTYYFALRLRDAGGFSSVWLQNPVFNPGNFAPAHYVPMPPQPVTDLSAAVAGLGMVRLRWTAPRNANLAPIAGYTIKMSTQSVASLGGDTTAWFDLAGSTTLFVSPARPPGSLEELVLSDVPDNQFFFFAVRSTDVFGSVSPIDARAASVSGQARIILTDAPIPLTAVPGPVSGSVELSWTEPALGGFVPPVSYRVRVSTAANFDDNAGFEAALPLSALSGSPIPAPAGFGQAAMVVTGLKPGTTYFFGVRLTDSDAPPTQTSWRRALSPPVNRLNFAPAHYQPNPADPVTDLAGVAGSAEGEVSLTWTAPRNQNFVPVAGYDVRAATAPAAGSAAPVALVKPSALGPGALESFTVTGLEPNATWWFSVRAVDEYGVLGAAGPEVSTRPLNLPPGAPSGLTALPGLRRASLAWSDVAPGLKGLDFEGFRLYRSTSESAGFVAVATAASPGFLDRPLLAFTSYWYKVAAYDRGGNETVAASTAAALPFTVAPMEPIGFRVSADSSTVTFGWSPTRRFSDSTPFDDPGAPVPDELQGYSIRRSTSLCDPVFTWLSSAPAAASAFTDAHDGAAYYYQIRAFNTSGPSTSTLVLSSLGEHSYLAGDCATRVILDDRLAAMLRASENGLGADVQLQRRLRPEDLGTPGVLQAAEFRAMLDGVTELKTFHFPRPVRVTLRYGTPGSGPGGLGAQAEPPAEHVGMYWHNGAEYKKLYGRVDALSKEVSVETPNMGLFQARALFRQNGAVFDLSNLSSRVITPNGDGLNDTLIFTYDPGPNGVLPAGAIYDLRGAYVAPMRPGLVPNTLTWDGTMNGRAVAGGVYVYQITGDGKTFNGTIVIAR